jgi:hypothetical protein
MSENNPYTAVVSAIPLGEELVSEPGEGVENAWEFVLNVGKNQGINESSEFLIFALGPELTDLENGEPLGHLEIVRGRCRVTHLQEKMCTVRSTRKVLKAYPKGGLLAVTGGETEEREVNASFPLVKIGDFARLIR